MSRLVLICLALAAANGCGPSRQNGGDSSAAESAIQAATQAWILAWEQGDVETLSNLYEQDAMYAANTGEVLKGRDGIREGVSAWVAGRPADIDLELEVQPVRFVFRDDDAHTVSRFVVRAMPAGCSLQAGHALVTWHRQSDGAWLIETELVNRDPQPPADACARKASIVPDDQSLSTLRSHPAYANRAVVFVNLLDFASDEARARYLNDYAGPALELVSAHGGSLLWAGPIDQQLVGEAGGEWDYAAFVRWPSRAAFIAMIESDDYRTLHDVRQETLRSTAIMVASDAGTPEE